jgi:hypothetical protein
MQSICFCLASWLIACTSLQIPATSEDRERTQGIAALVKQLGDPDFGKREAAERTLGELGRLALPQLEEGLRGSDPERQRRAGRLISAIRLRLSDETRPITFGLDGALALLGSTGVQGSTLWVRDVRTGTDLLSLGVPMDESFEVQYPLMGGGQLWGDSEACIDPEVPTSVVFTSTTSRRAVSYIA